MTPFPARYAQFTAFVAPARPRSELWRTALALIFAILFAFIAVQILLTSLSISLGSSRARTLVIEVATGATPKGVVTLLYAYMPMLVGLALALGLMMRRGMVSLIGPWRDATRNFLRVSVPLSILSILMMPLATSGEGVSRNLMLGQQLPWLPVALLGLLVQTGTEELVFRGYLQQQLGARYASPLIWMAIPSALFGLMHYSDAQFGLDAWIIVAWAGLFGLVTADLTARTGNLGAAVGLHFANNVSAVLLVGLSNNIGGLALFNVTINASDQYGTLLYLAIDTVTLAVSWLFARLVLRV